MYDGDATTVIASVGPTGTAWVSCSSKALHGLADRTGSQDQPTTIGVEHVRAKYAARLANSATRSTFDAEHSAVHDNFAIVIGHFRVEATDKTSGDSRAAAGRLTIAFRMDDAAEWKLILDIDNN